MRNAAVLAQLLDHQARILEHMAEATPLLDAIVEPDARMVAAKRWRLARMLREYQIFKHHTVFDPAIRLTDPYVHDQALRMKARCVAMGEAFEDYTRRWCRCGATGRWPAYRIAGLDMIGRLRRHMAREQRAVAALLAHPCYTGVRA